MTTGRDLSSMLCREWDTLETLCASLSEDQWRAATDCPGWNVKDLISHLVGVERMIAGHAAPEHEPPPKAHVKNPLGERNEIEVDFRRGHPPEDVLEEFRVIAAERGRGFEAMSDEDFDQPSWTPVGQGTVGDFVSTRIVDTWVHEQDIRRAIGVPGHLTGPIPDHVYARLILGLPKVVGKNAAAPDGSVVTFHVDGVTNGDVVIGVTGGRAHALESALAGADVRLVMNLQTFVCLTCGRWPPERTLRTGLVEIEGDKDLGEKIVGALNILF
jgi:uncharacterized protein (TIGR03083 family)